jgi:hypothetical protein
MITRRNCLLGASAGLACAPAVVRVGSLMPLRGVVMPVQIGPPVQTHYYGFVDRLAIDFRYRKGELRGPGLIQVIENGVLNHIRPAVLAYDIQRWGLVELSPAARRERAAFFNSTNFRQPWPRPAGTSNELALAVGRRLLRG